MSNDNREKYNGIKDQRMAKQVDTTGVIQFSDVYRRAIYHWPLYALVFLFSTVAALLYLRYARPIYSSSAKIYIKDEKKAGSASRQFTEMDNFGFLGGNKLVENEMEVIKSPVILKDVIRDNKFNVKYYEKGRVSNYEVYVNVPIHLTMLTDSSQVGNYFFDIQRKGNNDIELKYIYNGSPETVIQTRFEEPFVAGKDRFVINYNPRLNKQNAQHYQIKVDSILQMAYRKAGELTTTLVNKQSSVFEMTYEDGVAQRAADFLNAIADRYNRYTLDDKNQTTLKAIQFIEGRLESLGSELNVLEGNVEAFKRNRGITEIEQSSRLILEQVKDADQKLNEASIQLSVYDQVENYVNNPNNAAPYTPIGSVDPALASMIGKHEELLAEKKRLSLSLQPENPILLNLMQQIADSKSTIKNYISGFKRNANTAKAGLQRKVNQIENKIAQIPSYEREYISLKRQQSVKEGLYLYLLQKKEESSVSFASNIVDNKVISPAFVPTTPISPNKIGVILTFIVAGIFLASGYLVLKYLLNNRVIAKSDIEKVFEVPPIAEVFKKETTKGQVFFDSKDRNVLHEQIQNLRMNLKFLLNGINQAPIIQFTSSISGEGKSFLSAHLSNALTANQKKVILLELDLRKPKLSKSFGLDNRIGITNYLIGMNSLEEIIKKVPGAENLYIIPSGPVPPNPIELIESEKMRALLSDLRSRYDYIVIDTAPIGLVSDAKSLASIIDSTLFVVRYNHTPKAKMEETAAVLDKKYFKKLGIIFNGIDENSSFGYYNYGYTNYGNGYGYFASKSGGLKNLVKRFSKRFY